jgi:hypothetical protein
LAGAPPLQRLGQQDLKDLREIKARRARTPIETGTAIETAIGTKTASETQAHLRRAREDNIRPRTPTDDGLALETKHLVRSATRRG